MRISFLSGVVAGAAIAAVATMLMDPVSDRQRRRIKRGTCRMFRTVGGIIDDVMDGRF